MTDFMKQATGRLPATDFVPPPGVAPLGREARAPGVPGVNGGRS